MSERLFGLSTFRRWGGFLFSGCTAFFIDAGITVALIHFAGFNPFTARLVAILVATGAAWLMHRRITFNVQCAPSWREFARFFVVALGANGLNYVVFVAILVSQPATLPIVALAMSTAIAMLFSYAGFKRGVFRAPPPPG